MLASLAIIMRLVARVGDSGSGEPRVTLVEGLGDASKSCLLRREDRGVERPVVKDGVTANSERDGIRMPYLDHQLSRGNC